MDAIQLTGSDAAKITLALIADRHAAKDSFNAGQLQAWWRELGLRRDDLIQGLSVLSREGNLSIEGEGDNAILQLDESLLARLPERGEGLSGLEQQLKEVLELAAQRRSENSGPIPSGERRDGFK